MSEVALLALKAMRTSISALDSIAFRYSMETDTGTAGQASTTQIARSVLSFANPGDARSQSGACIERDLTETVTTEAIGADGNSVISAKVALLKQYLNGANRIPWIETHEWRGVVYGKAELGAGRQAVITWRVSYSDENRAAA